MVTIRRILVPTDFSDCATKAVRYAVELADKLGAELVLLHVVPDTVL
ncbi:MAG TPA: universal stress protein, partial [Gemmata sp.]